MATIRREVSRIVAGGDVVVCAIEFDDVTGAIGQVLYSNPSRQRAVVRYEGRHATTGERQARAREVDTDMRGDAALEALSFVPAMVLSRDDGWVFPEGFAIGVSVQRVG